jgi:HlyD family secretion protein
MPESRYELVVAMKMCLAAIVAVILSSCSHAVAPSSAPVPAVATVVSRTTTIAPAETLAGTIAPYQNVAIQSSLVEPTLAVYVNEGDIVHRGEVLAVLDVADMEADLQSFLETAASNHAKLQQDLYQEPLTITQGTDAVRSAQSTLAQSQRTLANDQLNLQREQALLRNGYIAPQAVDQQATTVNIDQQTVRSAQAGLVSARAQEQANGTDSHGLASAIVLQGQAQEATSLAQAAQIRTQISRATIVSPIDGVVVNRNLNPGEYPGTREIFTLQELDPVYAVLNASDTQLAGIRNGTNVDLSTPDDAGIHYQGKVVAVLGQVNPGSTNFIVKAKFRNPGNRLIAGVVVTARVALRPVHGVAIPFTAFLDTSHKAVMVVRAGATHTNAVRQLANDGTTAIVSGLAPGTAVVANGQLGLTDGEEVASLP